MQKNTVLCNLSKTSKTRIKILSFCTFMLKNMSFCTNTIHFSCATQTFFWYSVYSILLILPYWIRTSSPVLKHCNSSLTCQTHLLFFIPLYHTLSFKPFSSFPISMRIYEAISKSIQIYIKKVWQLQLSHKSWFFM